MSLLAQLNHLDINKSDSFQRSAFIEMLEAFVYAEQVISLNRPFPWTDQDIAKRRKTYEYDEQLQEILLYRSISGFVASKIECGKSNYYKCELTNAQGGIIHAGVSFTKSKYQESYIKKNIVHENPMYIFLQYQLNAKKTNVEKLAIRIPFPNNNDAFTDITRELNYVRNKMNGSALTGQQLIESITSLQDK